MTVSPSSPDMSEALARTRASYDETPYASHPLSRQQPARLAAAALWFGLTAPSARTARVLEIGCASGGHIIPLAALWPEARFVGVDISPVQVAAGNARIERLGLANIVLSARSFDEIGASDGVFDFIVCHGVYSWIPAALRETLLRIIAERLAPDGVASVSFNVLPGWRLFQIARDSLLVHARLQNDPAARGRQARELLERLSAESNNRYTYGQFWRDDARRIAAGGDAYIAHEMFEDDNEPLTFTDFCAALDRHGLTYVGECNVAANREDGMAPAGAETIRALARGDDRAREQYLDIFSGRGFREAVITHGPRAGMIRRDIRRDMMEALPFRRAAAIDGDPAVGDLGATGELPRATTEFKLTKKPVAQRGRAADRAAAALVAARGHRARGIDRAPIARAGRRRARQPCRVRALRHFDRAGHLRDASRREARRPGGWRRAMRASAATP